MAEQIAAGPGTGLLSALGQVSGKRSGIFGRTREDPSRAELYETIHEAWLEWQNALLNFEDADCKEMVDYYAYRIKASQIRYEYLLRKAKALQAR
ncbi:MAG TPA: DUF2508 family protein [Thermoclostridium sp.]|mgnify:FL=1|nr:DUF2508 family protein [Thermoclostridium sp.]HPU45876.1 DUF2508 family protein [Thermoclostridium sp.]